MTVIAVVAVISGLNNYVATKIFSLSPDVYAVTRWGIITSREEFLAALKRKPISKAEVDRVMSLAKSAERIGATSYTTKLARYEGNKLSDVQISGHDGEHVRHPEPRPRVRPLLHGDGERAPGLRRRDRLGRQGRALPAPRPARAHAHPERDSVPDHRRPRQAGVGPRPEPGHGRLHPARDALQGLGRDPEHQHPRAGEGRRPGRARLDGRDARDLPGAAAHGAERRPTRSRS